MNPVGWPLGSGYRSHMLLTPVVPPADAVPLPRPTGLPLAAPIALPVPFLFPVAVPLVFPRDGSCPLLYGGLQVSSTVEALSLPLANSIHVSTKAQKSLELQRGPDQLTIFIWLH